MTNETYLLHTDGASLGNPGHGGAGAVIFDSVDNITDSLSIYLGPKVTNNQAEYQGLIYGLKMALKHGLAQLSIRMDSELIVRQLQGRYKVKNENMIPLYQEAVELLKKFKSYEVAHVRREFNKDADALASKAAEKGSKGLATDDFLF